MNRCSLGRAAARYSVFASLLAVSSTITVLGSSLHTVQGSVDDCEWDAQTPRARGGDSAANPPTVILHERASTNALRGMSAPLIGMELFGT